MAKKKTGKNECVLRAHNIDKALKNLSEYTRDGAHKEEALWEKARKESNELEEKLLDVPLMRRAKEKVDKAYRQMESKHHSIQNRIRALKARFYSEGPSPWVQQELIKITKELYPEEKGNNS